MCRNFIFPFFFSGNGDERCHNGGECLEGAGLQYSCKCLAGWKGRFCDEEIDECEPAPCQNGGVCIDKLATFSCACPMGFSGVTCEEEILVCDNSPCRNSALCLMEEGQPVCYCVPDFHGEKCEYQYDECQLGTRCMNGGTCIDGIDDFSCSCPMGLTGATCDCLELQTGDLECNYTLPYDIYTSTHSTKEYEYSTDYSTTELYRNSKGSTIHPNLYNRYTTRKTVPTTDESFFTTFSTTNDISTTSPSPHSSTFSSTASSFSGSSSGSAAPGGGSSRSTTPSYHTTSDYGSMTTALPTARTSRPPWRPRPSTTMPSSSPTYTSESPGSSGTALFTTPDPNLFGRTTEDVFRTTAKTFGTDFYSTLTSPRTTMPTDIVKTTLKYDTKDITTDYSTSIDHNKFSTFETFTTTISPFFTEYPRGQGAEAGNTMPPEDRDNNNRTMTTRTSATIDQDKSTAYPPSSSSSSGRGTTSEGADGDEYGGATTTQSTFTTTDVDSYTGSPDCIRMPCFNGGTCVNTSEGSRVRMSFRFSFSVYYSYSQQFNYYYSLRSV